MATQDNHPAVAQIEATAIRALTGPKRASRLKVTATFIRHECSLKGVPTEQVDQLITKLGLE